MNHVKHVKKAKDHGNGHGPKAGHPKSASEGTKHNKQPKATKHDGHDKKNATTTTKGVN